MEELKKQLLAAAQFMTAQISAQCEAQIKDEMMVFEGSEIYAMARSIEIMVQLFCVIDDRKKGVL